MEKVIGYRKASIKDIPGYDASYNYVIINTTGDCMNNAASPISIPDGSQLLGHWIGRKQFTRNWEQYQGRVVCVFPNSCVFKDNYGLVKEFVRLDLGWFLVLRMYVPFKEFDVPVDCIKDEILIIDKVME